MSFPLLSYLFNSLPRLIGLALVFDLGVAECLPEVIPNPLQLLDLLLHLLLILLFHGLVWRIHQFAP
jgi:hypothetical protein